MKKFDDFFLGLEGLERLLGVVRVGCGLLGVGVVFWGVGAGWIFCGDFWFLHFDVFLFCLLFFFH